MAKVSGVYAEDNKDDRFLVSECLKEFFPELDLSLVNDGDSLEKILNEDPNKFCLIITDHYMPGPNGGDIIRRYSRMQGYENIPFILHTSSSDPEIKRQAIMNGAFACALKSGDCEELIGSVGRALKVLRERGLSS